MKKSWSFVLCLIVGLLMSAAAYVCTFDAKNVDEGLKAGIVLMVIFASLIFGQQGLRQPETEWLDDVPIRHRGPSNVEAGLAMGTLPVWMPLIVMFCYGMVRIAWAMVMG